MCQKFALPKSDLRSHSDLCLKRAASSIIDLKPGEVSEILALYQLKSPDFQDCFYCCIRVYFFRMSGMCRTCSSEWSGTEHSARTNRTVCGGYHILRWCRRNQDGGTDYLFFYIEFVYTLLIFLKLRNTKEMWGFFRGEEGLCKLWIQSPIVL